MAVNLDKPQLWKADVALSVDMYNSWFMAFAPATYRETRVRTTEEVEKMLNRTDKLRDVTTNMLRENPAVLFALRMCCAPPIARDRLVGLAGVSKNLVDTMETKQTLPPRMKPQELTSDLAKIGQLIERLADRDIFPWIESATEPCETEVYRAATIVADRLCGAQSDPIIRNAQEQRQLKLIKEWLEDRGYTNVTGQNIKIQEMRPGVFAFRQNVPGLKDDGKRVNIPIDAIIMPNTDQPGNMPLLIEAKSAGDFTNTNKRRKEEATKVNQLRRQYGNGVSLILFLCGYFDSGYLGYEAAEGIDWVWEHRIEDFINFGV